jgi:hypothetical protein
MIPVVRLDRLSHGNQSGEGFFEDGAHLHGQPARREQARGVVLKL